MSYKQHQWHWDFDKCLSDPEDLSLHTDWKIWVGTSKRRSQTSTRLYHKSGNIVMTHQKDGWCFSKRGRWRWTTWGTTCHHHHMSCIISCYIYVCIVIEIGMYSKQTQYIVLVVRIILSLKHKHSLDQWEFICHSMGIIYRDYPRKKLRMLSCSLVGIEKSCNYCYSLLMNLFFIFIKIFSIIWTNKWYQSG